VKYARNYRAAPVLPVFGGVCLTMGVRVALDVVVVLGLSSGALGADRSM
jgi:hypothetical protein